MILVFFLFYTASGLVAAGKLFETTFGLPFNLAVLIGAGTVVVYTFFGGFLAVSWTDVVQGLLMLAALLLVPVLLWQAPPTAQGAPVEFDRLWATIIGDAEISLLAVISSLAWGLGYFGQPHILARFKAIRCAEEIQQARRIAVSWTATDPGLRLPHRRRRQHLFR